MIVSVAEDDGGGVSDLLVGAPSGLDSYAAIPSSPSDRWRGRRAWLVAGGASLAAVAAIVTLVIVLISGQPNEPAPPQTARQAPSLPTAAHAARVSRAESAGWWTGGAERLSKFSLFRGLGKRMRLWRDAMLQDKLRGVYYSRFIGVAKDLSKSRGWYETDDDTAYRRLVDSVPLVIDTRNACTRAGIVADSVIKA